MPDPTGTPTRVPAFYGRLFAPVGKRPLVTRDVDQLTCSECKKATVYDHADLPAVGTRLECPNCGLDSRVPALPSQAGMAEPAIDLPPHSERS